MSVTTGAYPIENGFFVLVIAITCLQVIMILYIRYKDAYIHLKNRFQRVFNFIVLLIGIVAIFFLMGVAAFQFDDSPLSNNFHNACAGMTIFLELIYIIGQTIIGDSVTTKTCMVEMGSIRCSTNIDNHSDYSRDIFLRINIPSSKIILQGEQNR